VTNIILNDVGRSLGTSIWCMEGEALV